MTTAAAIATPEISGCGGPGQEEGELARAHRRALLAWYGKPLEGISDAILIDMVLNSRDPDISRAALAALTANRSR